MKWFRKVVFRVGVGVGVCAEWILNGVKNDLLGFRKKVLKFLDIGFFVFYFLRLC